MRSGDNRCSTPQSAIGGSTNRAEGDVDLQVFARFFAGTPTNGVMVDVGAARPDFLSVSASFRGRGWRVIALEPNPEFCEMHKRLGHEIYPYACGDHDEDNVPFVVVNSHEADYEGGKVSFESFSSLSIKDSYAALNPGMDVKEIRVALRKLDTVLAAHAEDVQEIDLVSIDVEGWELEVLEGLSFEKYRPKVIILENLFDDTAYVEAMSARGYTRWTHNHLNDVYVRRGFQGTGLNRFWMPFLETVVPFIKRIARRIQRIGRS